MRTEEASPSALLRNDPGRINSNINHNNYSNQPYTSPNSYSNNLNSNYPVPRYTESTYVSNPNQTNLNRQNSTNLQQNQLNRRTSTNVVQSNLANYPSLNQNIRQNNNQSQNSNLGYQSTTNYNNNLNNRNQVVNNNNNNNRDQPPAILVNPPRINAIGKMDGLFQQCFFEVRNYNIVQIIIITILIIGHILIWFSYKRDEHFKMVQTNQLKNIFVHLVIMFLMPIVLYKIFLMIFSFRNVMFAVRLANSINHAVQRQPIYQFESFQSCTSTTYYIIASQITYDRVSTLTSQMKKVHKNQTKNQISAAIKLNSSCLNCLSALCELGIFGVAIFGIVVLALADTSVLQKIMFISFICYAFFKNIGLIIVILALILSPFICIGILIFVCCCSKPANSGAFIPKTRKPNNDMIVNAGGACTICFMDFSTSDDVVVLPCSDKHMFHQLCIKGWLNVRSTTCPICRHDLRQDA